MSWVEYRVPALLIGFKVSLLVSGAAPGLRARDLTDPTTALHQRPVVCKCPSELEGEHSLWTSPKGYPQVQHSE